MRHWDMIGAVLIDDRKLSCRIWSKELFLEVPGVCSSKGQQNFSLVALQIRSHAMRRAEFQQFADGKARIAQQSCR